MIFLSIILCSLGILAIIGGIFLFIDDIPAGGFLAMLISAGLLLLGFHVYSSADSAARAELQQTANRQGIEVSSSSFSDNIITKSPCKISLDLQNGELVMHGTNNVVTKDKLESICAILAK